MKFSKILLFGIALLLTSCMAYMNKNVNPYYFGMKVVDNTKFEKTKSVETYDYTEDNAKYFFQKGYVVKAKSAFRNTFVHMSWAELAAKQMGSDVMLCKRKYVSTASGTSVLPWYVPGETYTINSSTNSRVSINGYGNSTVIGNNGYAVGSSSSSAYGTYNSNTSTTIQGPGRYDYYYVPYSYDYYDQYALFLVKKFYWSNNNTTMYSKSDNKSEILEFIDANEWFEILDKKGKFLKIKYNYNEGYIEGFIDKTNLIVVSKISSVFDKNYTGTQKTVSFAPIYDKPDMINSKEIGNVENNTVVILKKHNEKYYKVKSGNIVGYLFAGNITK